MKYDETICVMALTDGDGNEYTSLELTRIGTKFRVYDPNGNTDRTFAKRAAAVSYFTKQCAALTKELAEAMEDETAR